jgi:hypothetical protein
MLNGLDPLIIFQFYKVIRNETTETVNGVAVQSTSVVRQTTSVVPIYLSRALTGIAVESASKNIDIQTDQNPLTSGESGPVNQKTLGSVTTVNLVANRGSVGLTILLAMFEQLLDKVVSKEYEVTYVDGAVTVFGGLIHGFSVDQNNNDTLQRIKIEISRGQKPTDSVVVGRDPTASRLASTGATPPASAPTVSAPPQTGGSVIAPRML